MIYIGKVIPSVMEPPIEKDIFNFFREYRPKKIVIPDAPEDQKKIKTMGIEGIISGEMSALVRKNMNLLTRDCLPLDLDDVILTEKDLIETIAKKLKAFGYILHPSISHGFKGVRYRLLVPLDRSVKESEYKALIHFFLNKVLDGVIQEVDQSNLTWAQIHLLPVITQYINEDQVIIHEGMKRFPVDEALETAQRWLKDQESSKGFSPTRDLIKNGSKSFGGGSRYRNNTTALIESIVLGCEVGNRNNRIAQLTGGLLARAVDVKAVLELVKIANQHFSEPLPEKEVEDTFISIARKELGAN